MIDAGPVIYIGIDDTDMPETPGTNQLCLEIIARLAADYHAEAIVRHQLLDDPRIPYTSRNGSASIWFGRQQSSVRMRRNFDDDSNDRRRAADSSRTC